MTPIYVHHWLIESPDTAGTVVMPFGSWWVFRPEWAAGVNTYIGLGV